MRDLERPVLPLNRHEVVAEHQVHGDGMEQVVVDVDFLQIHELMVIALRQRTGARYFSQGILRDDPVSRCHLGAF